MTSKVLSTIDQGLKVDAQVCVCYMSTYCGVLRVGLVGLLINVVLGFHCSVINSKITCEVAWRKPARVGAITRSV